MKKILLSSIALLLILFTACNNSDRKQTGDNTHKTDEPKTQADSLMAAVMDGHDVGMAKYGKLNAMQKKVQEVLDSIAKLPARGQQAAAPYKAKLDAAAKDLTNALTAMDKWMEEFNMDSAVNNMEQRIKYLTEEKWKVGNVKTAILTSLQKADSILKARF